MPAAFNRSSNVSFFIPASLLFFKSVTTKDIVLGWTSWTNSGIGRILFPWKYLAYFSLLFVKSIGDFFFICAAQEAGIDGAFCADGIVLAGVDVDESAGHFSSGFEAGGLGR